MYYGGLADAEVIYSFAKVLGMGSALLVFFQWTPQIWTTYKMGVCHVTGASERGVCFVIVFLLTC
jgi:hypothetical protein